MFLPIGIVNTVRFDYASLTWGHWGGLLYLSLGTSIFAYFLWYYALERVEASKVSIFSNLQPVLTIERFAGERIGEPGQDGLRVAGKRDFLLDNVILRPLRRQLRDGFSAFRDEFQDKGHGGKSVACA